VSAGGEIGELAEATSGPLALHLLGILRAHEGRYDEAEEAFLGAVEAESELVGSYVELGLVYACRGEYGKMVEVLKQSVEAGAGGVRVYLSKQPLGDLTSAPEPGSYEHTRQCGGDNSEVVTPLVAAMSYLAEGSDEEAARMLEQALGDEPTGPPPLVALLALTYMLRGESLEADEAGIRRAAATAEGRAHQCLRGD
jgi:tetratricopeptide (TPR) repeat protein